MRHGFVTLLGVKNTSVYTNTRQKVAGTVEEQKRQVSTVQTDEAEYVYWAMAGCRGGQWSPIGSGQNTAGLDHQKPLREAKERQDDQGMVVRNAENHSRN